MSETDSKAGETRVSGRSAWLRVAMAGALMGWANLVPGVSGGTMLLVCGVYPNFVAAVADLTRLRLRGGAPLWMGVLGLGAGAAVLTSAGFVKSMVETYPVPMYSLFAGLTLGGIPLVMRRASPTSASVWIAAGIAFSIMTALAFVDRSQDAATGPGLVLLAGVAGASAMVLPGLSGSYLLLLLGQYVPILGAIEAFRVAALGPLLQGQAIDLEAALEAASTLVPFAVGVALGIALVAHLVRLALARAPALTYGVLLGLLVGAVPGLWPFRDAPDAPELASAAGCLAIGFVVTRALCRLDREKAAPSK